MLRLLLQRKTWFALSLIAVCGLTGLMAADGESDSAAPDKAKAKKEPAPAPQVTGSWIGEWGPYNPAQGKALDKGKCKALTCQVVQENGAWQATFEGDCGGPYKYTIQMQGREADGSVLFKGTTVLDKKEEYDWIGRATDKEFAGFYTSSHHVGVFRLEKAKE